MNTLDSLAKAVDSIVDAKLVAYKAAVAQIISPTFNLFNLVQIAGSEAKAHYGFKLFDNSKSVRDLDVVLKFKEVDRTLFEILQASSDKLITGYTGDQSSVPLYYTSEQKFKPSLYQFAYPYKGVMRWVEVFEAQAEQTRGEFVSLKQLVACAQEWGREKDYHFLKQVSELTANIVVPETIKSKANLAYLNGDSANTEMSTTTCYMLSQVIDVEKEKLQKALQEAHDVDYFSFATKLTVGQVKYLRKIFNKE